MAGEGSSMRATLPMAGELNLSSVPFLIITQSTEAVTIYLDPDRGKVAQSRPSKARKGKTMALAVGYVRISKEEAGSTSLRTQESAIRLWCQANGHTLKAIFTDEGVSGGTAPLSRGGASEAIKASRARGVEMLVVSKLDRMSRDLRDVLDLVDNTLKGKATLVSVSESFDANTPAGRMFLQLLGTFAEFERNKIRERTKDALATRRAQGRKTGGAVPFGYRQEDGWLIPEPSEQAVIEKAFELSAKGVSLADIAEQLNADGATTREGRPWHKQRVFDVLKSERRRREAKQ